MTDDRLTIICGDALEELRKLPSESVQCCVTSPPYFQQRDYGCAGQLGLEDTPEQYVEAIISVMREVRRVLKFDGTLWLNLGDTIWGDSPVRKSAAETFSKTWDKSQTKSRGGLRRTASQHDGLKPKDTCFIPHRVAMAMQIDGWWVRPEIIWNIELNPEYVKLIRQRCNVTLGLALA